MKGNSISKEEAEEERKDQRIRCLKASTSHFAASKSFPVWAAVDGKKLKHFQADRLRKFIQLVHEELNTLAWRSLQNCHESNYLSQPIRSTIVVPAM